MMYVQCRFEQQTPDGLVTTVGYIEERGAKVGNLVELKGEEGLWLVKSIGDRRIKSAIPSSRNVFSSLNQKGY